MGEGQKGPEIQRTLGTPPHFEIIQGGRQSSEPTQKVPVQTESSKIEHLYPKPPEGVLARLVGFVRDSIDEALQGRRVVPGSDELGRPDWSHKPEDKK